MTAPERVLFGASTPGAINAKKNGPGRTPILSARRIPPGSVLRCFLMVGGLFDCGESVVEGDCAASEISTNGSRSTGQMNSNVS
jgi:hypothetical protein